MKKYVFLCLAFYGFLHIAKLEVFPFYHFGMYSAYQPYKAMPYISYDIYIDEVKQNFADQDCTPTYTEWENQAISYDRRAGFSC